jgi:hypothetical protein
MCLILSVLKCSSFYDMVFQWFVAPSSSAVSGLGLLGAEDDSNMKF